MLIRRRYGKQESVDDVHREKTPGQYALELDGRLRQLAAMHNQIRFLIGVTLSILRDRNAFSAMGYRGLGCFAVQVLGIAFGQARELARLSKELLARPATLARFLSGQISYGVLRVMLPGTPRELEETTSELFLNLTVSEAQEMVALFKEKYDEACAAFAAARGEGVPKPKRKKREKKTRKATGKPLDPRVAELAQQAAEAGHPIGGGGSFETAESEEGRVIEVLASPGLAARFLVGIDLARCIEGEDLPVHACLEMWAAEMMSGQGAEALQGLARENPDWFRPQVPTTSDDDTPDGAVPDPVRDARNQERSLDRLFWKEVERDIHTVNDHWAFLDWTLPQIEKLDHLTPTDDMTLKELLRRLHELRAIDRRGDKALREGLWRFHRAGYFRDLEFVDIGHYGEARLHMSRSTVKEMVTLEGRLQRFDLIRAALDGGLIHESQASLLVTIATPQSEEAWIAHARQTTVRFLRDDIDEAKRMRVFDPEKFDRTQGVPSKRRTRTRAAGQGEDQGRPSAGQTCAADADPTQQHAADAPGQTGVAGGEPTQEHAPDAPGQTGVASGGPAPGSSSEATEAAPPRRPPARTPLPVPVFRSRLQLVVNDVNGCYDEDPFKGAQILLRFWVPSSMEPFIDEVMNTARIILGGWGGFAEALELCLDAFLAQYGDEALRELRKHPILTRDNWRCAVPTCGSRRNLQVHHLTFRSQGGSNKPRNLLTLCDVHHQHGVHEGLIRITGAAPDDLLWELGLQPDGTWMLVVDGRTIVAQDEGLGAAA